MKLPALKKEIIFLLFLIPALISHTLFIIFPFVKSLYYSLTNFDGLSTNYKFIGLENYKQVFQDSAMISSINFTLFYTFASLILITLFAIPLALVLDSKMKTRNLQRAIFFFPSVPSALAIGYIWSYIFSSADSGVLNYVFSLVGIPKIAWLAEPVLAKLSAVIVGVWAGLGWHAVLYLANLQTIPHEYYEAAEIDGATFRQRFFHITLPMLAPAMTVSLMILITGGLKVYEVPLALTGGGPGYETHSISQIIILRGISELLYGKASAMSIILFLFIAVITIFQVKVTQNREDRIR
jgi:raffinose/stachyose/melibiose transport system permease protein